MTKLSRIEARRRSNTLKVRSQKVFLDLREAPSGTPTFSVQTVLEITTTDQVMLDVQNGTVHRVTVDHQECPWNQDEHHLYIECSEGDHQVCVWAEMSYSNTGQGLHRYRDAAGDTYLYTQYEPADARAVYPCADQPDMKTHWQFTVHAPENWTVVNNGATLSHQHGQWTFAQTPLLSSYLTAIVAGPYAVFDLGAWDGEEAPIPLRALCRKELATALDAEKIAKWTKDGLKFFHERYQFPYPWGKYDQIFVPQYNLGAMENPGCVTFNEEYLHPGGATKSQEERLANTLLHEMCHMWFGDLVTPKWWEDLWLKESFADHESYAALRSGGFTEADAAFVVERKAWALQVDQMPTTHPIQADIVDVEAASQNFDGISYAKGAAVLAQLVHYVGEDAFVQATREYFQKHAFSTALMADLVQCLENASGRDLTHWQESWLTTSSPSVLRRSGECVVRGSQDMRPHVFDVGYYQADGTATGREEVRLEGASAPLSGGNIAILNDRDRTYAICELPAQIVLEKFVPGVKNSLSRASVWASAWQELRRGRLGAQSFVDAVLTGGTCEVGTVRAKLLSQALAALTYLPNRQQAATTAAAAGLDNAFSHSGEDARAWATFAFEAAGIAGGIPEIYETGSKFPLTTDEKWRLLALKCACGVGTESDIARFLSETGTGRDQLRAIQARAALNPSAALEQLRTDANLANVEIESLGAGIDLARTVLEMDELARDMRLCQKLWTIRPIQIASRLVRALVPTSLQGSAGEKALSVIEQAKNGTPTFDRLLTEIAWEEALRLRLQKIRKMWANFDMSHNRSLSSSYNQNSE
ncbi:MAG: aminopeptidase N [Actinomycetaceae bacterium]|nr:aminopeptidase N [Actinomycetaceae bacterium]